MRAPRLLLTIVLPMIGGAISGAIYRGDFGGGYMGMIVGLLLGVMVTAFLFAGETLANKRHPATPFVVGILAGVATFGIVHIVYQPPPTVLFRQAFGTFPPDAVENLHGDVRYAYYEHAILLRFEIEPEAFAALREQREDLEPHPEDEPLDYDLEPFNLPAWWDLDPRAEHLEHYRGTVDFAADAQHEYRDSPPMDDDHVGAHHFFSRPGQLFYDPQRQVAWYLDRSYWEEVREDDEPEGDEPG